MQKLADPIANSAPRARRSLRRALVPIVLAAALVVPATAIGAAKVKGTIVGFRSLANPVWNESSEASKHGYSFREPVPTVRAEFRKLFPHIPKELCVAAIAATAQKPPKPILIRVGGGRTTPVTIVVPPGTALQFQNTDPFKHRLYGVKIATFQPGDTVKGGTRDWSVPGAGVFEIRDELAPSLRMWIIGEPNVAAIAYPSMKGDFQLTVEEPGDYTVQAYFAGAKVGPAKTVSIKGGDVDMTKDPIKVAEEPKSKSDKDADEKGK